jgi:hypothetical protein
MQYKTTYILNEPVGNNALSWEDRYKYHENTPSIYIPAIKPGKIEDVELGRTIVFEEYED